MLLFNLLCMVMVCMIWSYNWTRRVNYLVAFIDNNIVRENFYVQNDSLPMELRN